MKKFLSIALALVMTLALAVTCFAANEVGLKTGESATNDVTVTYAAGDTNDSKVYAVDVAFGALTFNFKDAGTGAWDTENHEYTDIPAEWTASGNNVQVTNHSNDGITATFSIDFEEVTTVTATYTGEGVEDNVLTLGSAEAAGGAVSSTVTVELGGKITEAQAGTFTLTVAIAAAVVVE